MTWSEAKAGIPALPGPLATTSAPPMATTTFLFTAGPQIRSSNITSASLVPLQMEAYKGSVSSDGHNYTTYEHQQVNQPSIQGTATFEQYLDNWGGSSIGSNHAVTTGNHFNHWNNIGMHMGSFNYQILGTESFGGRSGNVNATVWQQ